MVDWFYTRPLVPSGTLVVVALSLAVVAGILLMRWLVCRRSSRVCEGCPLVGR